MAEIITSTDLPASVVSSVDAAELALMIAGANARASRVAPCLASASPPPSADQLAEAKLILVGALKRWAEAGSGAKASQTAGPFAMTVDTRQRGGYNLWPSEITQLQEICGKRERSAFQLDTAPTGLSMHAEACALVFGAAYCDCGADIAGVPLWGDDE
ncbi:hypothetical protein [Nocardia thailandica]